MKLLIDKLRQQIEISISRKVQTPKDFKYLADCIYSRLHQQISATTLKRIWGYQQDEGPSRITTLDILARFCGYANWDSFAADAEVGMTQSAVILNRCLYSDHLKIGNLLVLTWAPNRRCEVSYLGNHRFEILVAENTKLQVGNTFKCDVFIENEPLYLYDLVQGNLPGVCYSAGRKDGIRFELVE